MTDHETHAWILFSIPDAPRTLDAVIGTADAHNKSIPSVVILNESLSWLHGAGLVNAKPGSYSKTEIGKSLVDRCRADSSSIYAFWNSLAEALTRFRPDTNEPIRISDEEYSLSVKAFRDSLSR